MDMNRWVCKFVMDWFWNCVEIVFGELFMVMVIRVEWYGIIVKLFKICWMKNCWGSCIKEGCILLNFDLIIVLKLCIEYVIVYEFCYLKEYIYGFVFYWLFKKLMFDWEKWCEWLNDCVIGYDVSGVFK